MKTKKKFLCNLISEKLLKQWASHNRLGNLSKTKKRKTAKKEKKMVENFSIFLSIFLTKQNYTKKTLVNW